MSSPDKMSLTPADTQAFRLRIYIGAQAALAILVIGVAFVHTGVPNWPVTIVLAAVTAIAERLAPRVSATVEMSVSFLPIALAAVLFGPAVAGIVAGCSMLGYVREWPLDKFTRVHLRAGTWAERRQGGARRW